MKFYDAASINYQVNAFEPLFLELNGILYRGEQYLSDQRLSSLVSGDKRHPMTWRAVSDRPYQERHRGRHRAVLAVHAVDQHAVALVQQAGDGRGFAFQVGHHARALRGVQRRGVAQVPHVGSHGLVATS